MIAPPVVVTVDALHALARQHVPVGADEQHIVAALLPSLPPGARGRLWRSITLAESAWRHLAGGDPAWPAGLYTPRRPGEHTTDHLLRALALAGCKVRDCCLAAAVADRFTADGPTTEVRRVGPDLPLPAQRLGGRS